MRRACHEALAPIPGRVLYIVAYNAPLATDESILAARYKIVQLLWFMAKRAARGEAAVRRALARNLVRLREAAGMSQSELARRSKVSRMYIYEIETGKANVGLGVLTKLASALGVETTDLLA